MNFARVALAVLIGSTPLLGAPAEAPPAAEPERRGQGEVEITYVGNEGFLLTADAGKVLIDALYREGVAGYAVHAPELRAGLEAATPPFDGVDLVLATHFHADHFDAEAVGEHLAANPRAIFVSTEQAVDRMRSSYPGFAEIEGRVRAVYPEEGKKQTVDVPADGISLRVLNLHHGRGRPIQNLGFLVEVGGVRFLHVGDTEADADDFAIYDLDEEKIDAAFLPHWHLRSAAGAAMVNEQIAPRRVILMHLEPAKAAPGDGSPELRRIRERFPEIVAITRPMDSRILDHDGNVREAPSD